MAGSPLPGGQTTPPNINSLAAQGIQGAGMGTANALRYSPQQVSVAGNSATVNPNYVTGSNVNAMNVTGSNVNPMAISGQNVTGSNVANTNVTPQTLASTSLTPYMNPYNDAVIKANEADILRGANLGLGSLQSQAQAAGAFGGSRHGIAMGEIGRETLDTLAQSSAGLRQAGFQNSQNAALQDIGNNFQGQLANQGANMQGQLANQANALQAGLANQGNALDVARLNQATGLQGQLANQSNALQAQGMNQQYGMQGQLANQGNALQSALANQSSNMQGQLANQSSGLRDIGNQLQASLANQSAGLQGQQQRLGAANQLGQLSNLGFGMGQQVNQNLAQQGAMQQALQQMVMDNATNKFNQYANFPAQGLGYLTSALNATPLNNVQNTTQTLTKTPGLFDYLSLGASGYTGGN
tara:strand:+ start:445 stop:1683 length:1239 start_codon:yes stop_codon:yes gene_type:complete